MAVREKPMFSGRKALLIWLFGAVITSMTGRSALELFPIGQSQWAFALMAIYFAGHLITAVALTRGRLKLALPVNRSWVDALVIVGAPWVGAIAWYREWKKEDENRATHVE